MKLHKVFLAISAAFFLACFSEFGSSFGYGILKPLSAVFFILFFIFQLLDKESALYAAEHLEQLSKAEAMARSQRSSNQRTAQDPVKRTVTPQLQSHARA